MEQQLKQQLMQKKTYANLSQKKRKYSFFHLTIRKNSTNYKKKHHPPSYQKVAYTFQNDIQSSKNCTKAFYEKRKVYAQINKKKTLTKSHQFI